MTHDPERLLSASNSSSIEHELLSSLHDITPPTGADDEVWKGLNRQLALAGLVGVSLALPKAAAATALSAQGPVTSVVSKSLLSSALGKSLAVKVIAVATLGAVGTSAVYVALQPRTAPLSVVEQLGPPTAATGTDLVARPLESLPRETLPPVATQDPVPPLAPAPKAANAQNREDALARESALLVQARSALRAGQTGRARSLLAELESRYAHGMLSQEREVLNIELLAASGEQKAAARRARTFIARHPKSPHAGKLARFVDAP